MLTLPTPISLSISVFMCPTATCVPADTIFWRSNCYADNVLTNNVHIDTMLWISQYNSCIALCRLQYAQKSLLWLSKQTFMFLHFCFQSKIANNRSIYKFILYMLIILLQLCEYSPRLQTIAVFIQLFFKNYCVSCVSIEATFLYLHFSISCQLRGELLIYWTLMVTLEIKKQNK